MCSGSKSKLSPSQITMENGFQKHNDGFLSNYSLLLEFSASDDLESFIATVEAGNLDVDESSLWYGRQIGSRKMGFDLRTPLAIAAMYGSNRVLNYIIQSGKADVNRSCGSDKVTALHCAAAGGSHSSPDAVKLLLAASADPNCANCNGFKPVDLLAPVTSSAANSRRKAVEMLLRGEDVAIGGEEEEEAQKVLVPMAEKKEYPVDVSMPDINNGIYGSDDFRMYSFKIKPCSRAYTHDWTECPFVHPGENARRRDPRKYPYSCVPCPEFRKGSCQKADACEYAHGVFESWLHPAQYRTRLCKDETGCSRKVCFFAHKQEDLRPVYAATGSAMPSPRSLSVSGADMAALSPLALGPSSLSLPQTSTPPMSPLAAAASSPKNNGLWQSKVNVTPPTLQLSGSRLKTAFCARDLDLEMELLGHENQNSQQQLMEEISRLSSPFSRMGDLKPTNLDDVFGSFDPTLLSQLQGMPLKPSTPTQLQSPTGLQIRQNMSQLRASYPASLSSSSPMRKPSSFGLESSASSMAAAVMNSRAAAFKQRSQSFIDRGAVGAAAGAHHHHLGLTAAANSVMSSSSNFSDWSSPNGRLDWAVQGDELNKLRKSASFGFRNNNVSAAAAMAPRPSAAMMDEPDVSWVNTLVKDVPAEKHHYHQMNKGVREVIPPWVEQLYIEQEQLVA